MSQHPEEGESSVNDETRAIEEVINAFMYYGKFGTEKILKTIQQMKYNIFRLFSSSIDMISFFRNYPQDFQILVVNKNKEFVESMKQRIEHNHR